MTTEIDIDRLDPAELRWLAGLALTLERADRETILGGIEADKLELLATKMEADAARLRETVDAARARAKQWQQRAADARDQIQRFEAREPDPLPEPPSPDPLPVPPPPDPMPEPHCNGIASDYDRDMAAAVEQAERLRAARNGHAVHPIDTAAIQRDASREAAQAFGRSLAVSNPSDPGGEPPGEGSKYDPISERPTSVEIRAAGFETKSQRDARLKREKRAAAKAPAMGANEVIGNISEEVLDAILPDRQRPTHIPAPPGGWDGTALYAAAVQILGPRPSAGALNKLVVCRSCLSLSKPDGPPGNGRGRLTGENIGQCARPLCRSLNLVKYSAFADEVCDHGIPAIDDETADLARRAADAIEAGAAQRFGGPGGGIVRQPGPEPRGGHSASGNGEWRSADLMRCLEDALEWDDVGMQLQEREPAPTKDETLKILGEAWDLSENQRTLTDDGAKLCDGYRVRGGANPRFWMGTDTTRKPTLEGAALVDRVRTVLGLAQPSAVPTVRVCNRCDLARPHAMGKCSCGCAEFRIEPAERHPVTIAPAPKHEPDYDGKPARSPRGSAKGRVLKARRDATREYEAEKRAAGKEAAVVQ